jgi:hypothetical protein
MLIFDPIHGGWPELILFSGNGGRGLGDTLPFPDTRRTGLPGDGAERKDAGVMQRKAASGGKNPREAA